MAVIALPLAAHAGADYAPGSTEWNGLSRLLDEARANGCEVLARDDLDWSELRARDALWFVYPRVPLEAGKLRQWLATGGRVVIADDFGAAGPALESLEIRRGPRPNGTSGAERYHANPELPVARPHLLTELGRAAPRLVGNHPASFATAIPATYEFAPGAALVVEGKIGRGYFVALADPSVLINNMLEIDEQRAFAATLVRRTCSAGQRILLFTQTFRSHGEPPDAPAQSLEGSPFQRFNQMLSDANSGAASAARDGRALTALASLVALVMLIIAAGAFPARSPIRDRWTRARLTESAWSGLLEHASSAAILREELLERLGAVLDPPPAWGHTGPQALARQIGSSVGPAAAQTAAALWRLLHKIRWRTVEGDWAPAQSAGWVAMVPVDQVSPRQLAALHRLATDLFTALSERS